MEFRINVERSQMVNQQHVLDELKRYGYQLSTADLASLKQLPLPEAKIRERLIQNFNALMHEGKLSAEDFINKIQQLSNIKVLTEEWDKQLDIWLKALSYRENITLSVEESDIPSLQELHENIKRLVEAWGNQQETMKAELMTPIPKFTVATQSTLAVLVEVDPFKEFNTTHLEAAAL